MTDNESAEIKAFNLLDCLRLSCFGHNLNLAVKAALKVEEIQNILEKCRKLVQYLHKSDIPTAVLKRVVGKIEPKSC